MQDGSTMVQSTPSFSDVFVGFMQIAQSRGAKGFPLPEDPSWHLFFNALQHNLGGKIPFLCMLTIDTRGTYPVVSELIDNQLLRQDLEMCAIIDRKANLMRLRPDSCGSDFACDLLPEAVDEMFYIGRAIFRF